MNELQKKCAKIDGYIFDIGRGWFDRNGQKLINGIPAYDNETDILRVVRLLEPTQRRCFASHLIAITFIPIGDVHDQVGACLCATAEQMLEALATALGVQDSPAIGNCNLCGREWHIGITCKEQGRIDYMNQSKGDQPKEKE